MPDRRIELSTEEAAQAVVDALARAGRVPPDAECVVHVEGVTCAVLEPGCDEPRIVVTWRVLGVVLPFRRRAVHDDG